MTLIEAFLGTFKSNFENGKKHLKPGEKLNIRKIKEYSF